MLCIWVATQWHRFAKTGVSATPFCVLVHLMSAAPVEMEDVHTKVVSVEGGIGIGKSTIMDRLKEMFADNPHVVVIPEPVQEWIDKGFLESMYTGKLSSGEFQHMVLMSLAGDLLQAIRARPALIITERSPYGNYHVFGKANLTGESLELYKHSWERVLRSIAHLDVKFVWLRAPVQTLQARIQTRGRAAESGIDTGYLEKLEKLHAEWFAEMESDKFVEVNAATDKTVVWSEVCNALMDFSCEAKAKLRDQRETDDSGKERKRRLDLMIEAVNGAAMALGEHSPRNGICANESVARLS